MIPITISRDATAAPRGFALFAYGFRPFFLLAGLQACLGLLVWLHLYFGGAAAMLAVAPVTWHAHEMVFGYAVAVIAGFLLTTTSNWTGTRSLRGPLLMGLGAVWLAGRIVYAFGRDLPPELVAAVDLAFLPFLAAVIGIPIFRAGQRRQYVFVIVLAAFFIADLLAQADILGFTWVDARSGLKLGVYLATLLIVVMGGRIIPSFTTNALRRRGETLLPMSRPWIEWSAAPLVVLAAIADLADEGSAIAGAAALAAAVAHGLRLAGWRPLRTGFSPILWILHVGYAWLVLGFALQGLAAFVGDIPPTAAFHALTAGAIGVLTLGVMSRVALGHTGRDLVVAPMTVVAYVLVNLAAALRVGTPILFPGAMPLGIAASGLLWSLAFALFVSVYAPILVRPRIDGQPG